MDRREFLQTLGLASSATLLSSCGSEKDQKKLISYLVPPDDGVLPGEARWVPGTCTECPAGCGIQVRVRERRAVKLEGIADHPISSGGLCMRGQASMGRLYHPERFRSPLERDGAGGYRRISWEEAYRRIGRTLGETHRQGKTNLYLAGRTTGTLSAMLDSFCAKLAVERAPDFELFAHAALRQAYGLLFGRPELPRYRVEEADFLLTLGADLFETFVSPVGFAAGLARASERGTFRWEHLEPHVSLTGVNADRRLPLVPGSEPYLLLYLLSHTTGKGERRLPEKLRRAIPPFSARQASALTGVPEKVLGELLDRLERAERPLVIVGGLGVAHRDGMRAAVFAGLLQWLTGMTETTVDFDGGENYRGVGSLIDMDRLARRLGAGEVGVLFISRADPLYQVPDSIDLAGHLKKATLSVAFADLPDETSQGVDLILPLAHPLETWGDAEPRSGVHTLVQPASPPLDDTRGEGDILLDLMRQAGDGPDGDYRQFLEAAWDKRFGPGGRQTLLEKGFLTIPQPEVPLALDAGRAAEFFGERSARESLDGPLLVVAPSIRTFDGRSAALPLLAEIPDPLTTVTYGSWVSLPPSMAARLKAVDRDELALTTASWGGKFPGKVQPGLQEGVLVIQRDALVGAPYGWVPASGEALFYLEEVQVEKTGGVLVLAVMAGSASQQGRGLIPDPVHRKEEHRRADLYPPHAHEDYRWTLAIDLSRCIGCGACVASCSVENNVPVVGEADHLKGREMSWLRIEPFYNEDGGVEFLPMLCQHCHHAPCEPVCPVYAAYHNGEGLNVQVYDRCVGTRYCSNNCPYKVRRFNWRDYHRPEPLPRMLNPDLSVRSRGMMEKCTFCIQRLRHAKDRARDEGRKVRDAEVTTACAQSCPTGAIVFGNLLDANSRVYALAHSERAYRVFEELGTEPSVFYLAKAVTGDG
ncbi:Fe-S-cluster-containing dehydrogenase component [Desulfuromonas soudanensis]|uniref:Fe-S-cluster-containing dehydrogenase component n=1 Tax=Desulfuromonas soudanensis TaxID=1603606 RepID=A0A0M4D1Z2_9BACT|nr:4Fe-4S dicluster domain-containing protein [Desulfuromonas soudanensis]ALC17190.1 Fe-S-cluster-containing dehydrogenase component [Desulfuromonas soudanensis]